MAAYIQISYILTEQEMIDGLRSSGLYKSTGKRAWIETAVLGGMLVMFTVFFILRREWFDFVMAILCVVIGLLLNLVPFLDMKKKARVCEKNIRLRIYPGEAYVYLGQQTVTMPLNRETKVTYSRKKAVYTIKPQGGGFLVLPERAVPAEKREEIQGLLREKT